MLGDHEPDDFNEVFKRPNKYDNAFKCGIGYSMGSETNMTPPPIPKGSVPVRSIVNAHLWGQGETSQALRSSTKSGKPRVENLEAITKKSTMVSYIGLCVLMSTSNGNIFGKCRKKKWPIE
jgi:hypothetical protein